MCQKQNTQYGGKTYFALIHQWQTGVPSSFKGKGFDFFVHDKRFWCQLAQIPKDSASLYINLLPILFMLLLCLFFSVGVKVVVLGIWAVWSDGTAEVVNNLLQHTALCRVTNVRHRNGPAEVRAGLLTSATPPLRQNAYIEKADRHSLMAQFLMESVFCVYLALLK